MGLGAAKTGNEASSRLVMENQDTKQECCQGTIMKDKEGVEVIEEKVKR
jgi:hypothetical protein